jgi:hypothetical protein
VYTGYFYRPKTTNPISGFMDMALILKNNIVADLSIGNGSHNNTMNIQNQYKTITTRKNCFRYLKLMSPLNAAICTTISYTL